MTQGAHRLDAQEQPVLRRVPDDLLLELLSRRLLYLELDDGREPGSRSLPPAVSIVPQPLKLSVVGRRQIPVLGRSDVHQLPQDGLPAVGGILDVDRDVCAQLGRPLRAVSWRVLLDKVDVEAKRGQLLVQLAQGGVLADAALADEEPHQHVLDVPLALKRLDVLHALGEGVLGQLRPSRRDNLQQ